MELKPIKERKKNLYPTISESKKSNYIKNIVFSTAYKPIMPVEVPGYIARYEVQLGVFRYVRNVTFITTAIFLFLLIKNKIKMKKAINQAPEKTKKIKKNIKLDWILLIISIIVMVATIIGIVILKDKMYGI